MMGNSIFVCAFEINLLMKQVLMLFCIDQQIKASKETPPGKQKETNLVNEAVKCLDAVVHNSIFTKVNNQQVIETEINKEQYSMCVGNQNTLVMIKIQSEVMCSQKHASKRQQQQRAAKLQQIRLHQCVEYNVLMVEYRS